MTVEFIVAIALIVGVSELKEWRILKRAKELERLIKVMGVRLKAASAHSDAIEKQVKAVVYEQGQLKTEVLKLMGIIDAHGVRVNYKPQQDEEQHIDLVEL